MKRFLAIAALLFCLALPAHATTRYVAQSSGTFSGGSSCNGQTAISIATFNALGSYTAGDLYYFCGAITTPPVINGSGTSGNVVTFKWDTGARISVAYGQIIDINGASAYLLFDGGIPCGPGTSCYTVESSNLTGYASGQAGIIEATANGSSLAHQNTSTQAFWGCNGCHDIEIRNLIIRNLYQHTSTTDVTNSADTGNFVFQCASGSASGCVAGTLSIHDSAIHDTGNAISIEKNSSNIVKLYNLEMWRNNWEVENSGDGTRTLFIYGNHWHDAANWDTTTDAFHHNGVHNYMNTSSDSLGFYVYNNIVDGNWGSCCATANFLFTEDAPPASSYVFNNVILQSCTGLNTEPANQEYTVNSGAGKHFYNNTFLGCSTTASNVDAVDLYGTSQVWENNAVQGYGQYVVTGSSATFSTLDYNIYGLIGTSGNPPWQCGATGYSSFSTWQSGCSADTHGQKVSNIDVSATTGVPTSGSPLIGAAANLTSLCSGNLVPLCQDAAGNARPSTGPWTAGALNYGTTPITPGTAIPLLSIP